MRDRSLPDPLPTPPATRWRIAAAIVLALAGAAGAAHAGEGFSGGIEARPDASVDDVGLPAYPGAVRQQDRGDDKSAVTLGLWGGSFGLKLVVLKFASGDRLDSVAAFYRDALGRYGKVLDCSQPPPKATPRVDKSVLDCDGDTPEPGERLYKVGTPKAQRIVSLKQVGNSVHFQMVRLEATGT